MKCFLAAEAIAEVLLWVWRSGKSGEGYLIKKSYTRQEVSQASRAGLVHGDGEDSSLVRISRNRTQYQLRHKELPRLVSSLHKIPHDIGEATALNLVRSKCSKQ